VRPVPGEALSVSEQVWDGVRVEVAFELGREVEAWSGRVAARLKLLVV